MGSIEENFPPMAEVVDIETLVETKVNRQCRLDECRLKSERQGKEPLFLGQEKSKISDRPPDLP